MVGWLDLDGDDKEMKNMNEICMTEEQINFSIKNNYNSTITNNKIFNRHGYLILKNFVSPQNLYHPDPGLETGELIYEKNGNISFIPVEHQVIGSMSRYSFPGYKNAQFAIKQSLEKIIKKELNCTYYYDRFYFPGQKLNKHIDRDSCEISVSIHVGSNANIQWPFYLIDKLGNKDEVYLEPGDAILYMGCEVCHWRDAMPGIKRNKIKKIFKLPRIYYHQIFFHYVLQDGKRVHYTNDHCY